MTPTNRTKIVCTVGPATEDDDVLREMMRAGMSVARLNFSHGTHDYHRHNIERVRRIAQELGVSIAIMVDTKGPEIRTGLTVNHEDIELAVGSSVTITTEPVAATKERFSISYQALPNEVSPGSVIYVDDGLIELRVREVVGTEIHCTVVNSGILKERKGVNVPNVVMQLPSVTEQDRDDIRFACEMKADAIAASFIRDANAVCEIRALCQEFGRSDTLIISKIESSLALDNLDEIIAASDGIMVARGDLGIEIPPSDVPHLQKEIIGKCNAAYKPVITATQMLDSMMKNPRPTRAEVTDVANAVYDGTDCVMLSGETAAGAHPVESVRMMAEICTKAEAHLSEQPEYHRKESIHKVSDATSFGAVELAERVGASALLCPTDTGQSARVMAAFRPHFPIIAASRYERTVRRACFIWGVRGLLMSEEDGLAQICYGALKAARHAGLVKTDDIVVITAGDPVTSPLTTWGETATNVSMVAQVF